MDFQFLLLEPRTKEDFIRFQLIFVQMKKQRTFIRNVHSDLESKNGGIKKNHTFRECVPLNQYLP